MICLDRADFDVLAATWATRWATSVEKTFKDKKAPFTDRWPLFETESVDFEAEPLAGGVRRAGYKAFAPASLPQSKGKPKWPPKWRQWKSIKKGLLATSRNKCSYCESGSGADQWGQVEHFHPKSLFPTQAYEWGNYLYSCEICNVTKSNKWPDAGSYLRPDAAGFDPTVLTFETDGSVVGAAGDAAATVEDFGLDRDGLKTARETVLAAKMRVVAELIADDELSVASRRKYVRKSLAEPEEIYSEAVNQVIRSAWEGAFAGDPL